MFVSALDYGEFSSLKRDMSIPVEVRQNMLQLLRIAVSRIEDCSRYEEKEKPTVD